MTLGIRGRNHLTMVAEVVSSMMGYQSDRRLPNLLCTKAFEAVQLIRRGRADFHQGQEHLRLLHLKAECMAATDYYPSRQTTIGSGLGP